MLVDTSGGRAISAVVTVASAFFLGLAGLVVADRVPVVVVGAYALLSVLAFGMYGVDKSAAKKGQWRTSESTLHTIAVVGGWPGALVARQVFRHKTTKQPFRTIFWCTVVANCVLLAWFVLGAPVSLSV